jgi:hypothetical protein
MLTTPGGVRLSNRRTEPERTPVGINVGVGSVAMVAAGLVGVAVPGTDGGLRFAVVALAVAGFAAATLDELALVLVVPLGFGILNGFLENQHGQLSWHGPSDLWRLMVLVISAALGLTVGETVAYLRRLRTRWLAELHVQDNEEERRDG